MSLLNLKRKGKKLIFTAKNEKRKFIKAIPLPFKSSERECEVEVNNGIAIINISKTD